MPFDWLSEAAWRQNNREGEWRFGGGKYRSMRCRVKGASAKPSTSNSTYWDCIPLGDGDTEIDLKASGQFPSNVLPVRPLLINVADRVSASYNPGDLVTVEVEITVGRRQGVVHLGDSAEDYCHVFPGSHRVISAGGSAGCAASFFNLGVYYG